MDSPVEEIQYTKATPSSTQDGTKKKKSTRKKPEAKPPKTVDLEVPEIPIDPNQDINIDLIQHAYKLEHELAVTKKKLKNQRRKFRQLIYSLAKYVDAKGITANIVDEYVRGIRPQLVADQDQDSESDYDKFYSTYKYVVMDEHGQQNGKVISTTNGHKSASKPSSNALKGSTTDADQDAVIIAPDASQETAAQQQKTTKTGRPKKDPAAKEAKANGEEPKKRKTKKQKEGEDRKGSVEAIDLEEIPNPNKGKNDDNAFHIPALDENSNSNSNSRGMMRQQPSIPNLDPNEIMKAMMMNPAALGMNIPGMGMLPGLQGMQISENDMAMFSKAMEEMMTKGGLNLGNLLGGADMMNYYPGNFK